MNNTLNNNAGAGRENAALRNYFVMELADIYDAEDKIVDALPDMISAATTDKLKMAFDDHLEQSKTHMSRLESIFQMLDEEPRKRNCDAVEDIIETAEDNIDDTEDGSALRDVALIMSAQKIEHHEIATYGSLATLAKTLGLDEVASLLQQTLDEEKQADLLLTDIAENNVNYMANNEEA